MKHSSWLLSVLLTTLLIVCVAACGSPSRSSGGKQPTDDDQSAADDDDDNDSSPDDDDASPGDDDTSPSGDDDNNDDNDATPDDDDASPADDDTGCGTIYEDNCRLNAVDENDYCVIDCTGSGCALTLCKDQCDVTEEFEIVNCELKWCPRNAPAFQCLEACDRAKLACDQDNDCAQSCADTATQCNAGCPPPDDDASPVDDDASPDDDDVSPDNCDLHDNGDGTATDPCSGLMWQANPPATVYGESDAAVDYCTGLNLAGHADWRLPDIDALRTLVRGCPATQSGGGCGVTDQCFDPYLCDGVGCDGCNPGAGPTNGCYWPSELSGPCSWYSYWSTTVPVDDDIDAWGIEFDDGRIDYNSDSYHGDYARCVR